MKIKLANIPDTPHIMKFLDMRPGTLFMFYEDGIVYPCKKIDVRMKIGGETYLQGESIGTGKNLLRLKDTLYNLNSKVVVLDGTIEVLGPCIEKDYL
jgi:hypothetical protein